ncbi:putative ABC transporter, partial [Glonium stellatum]
MGQTSHNASVLRALGAFRYLTPLLVAAFFGAASAVVFCTLQSSKKLASSKTRHSTALWLTSAVLVSYVVESALYVLRALVQQGWWAPQDAVLYVMTSVLVWGCIFLVLWETKAPVWTPYVGSWVCGFGLEVVVCTLSTLTFPREDNFDNARLALQTLRIFILLILSGNGILLAYGGGKGEGQQDEEQQSLLGNAQNGSATPSQGAAEYGAIPNNSNDNENGDEDSQDDNKKLKEQQRKRLQEEGGWLGYLKGFLIFLPYVWPSKDRRMQFYVALIGLCLVAERLLNVLTPRQLGIIVDRLSSTAGTGQLPWKEVALWMFYRWLSSRACLAALQSVLQLRINYWSYIQLTSVAFSHVMGLSMDFHDNKDSGELIKSVEQANALNSLIELVLFETSPIVIDLFIALAYVTYLFDVYFAFVIIVVGVVYTIITYKFTSWTAKMRRTYTENSRNQTKILYESVSNWQTVSYFNRADFEQERLAKALGAEVKTGQEYYDSTYIMFGAQELVMLLGRLTVSFMGAYRVSQGSKPIGNFVALSTYWNNLSYPLWMLAYSYRQLTSNLIDAERLLQLLKTKSKVSDREGAQELKLAGGKVEFTDVNFAYDERKPTIKDISFVANPGETVALVGETGSGKSTTLKLLFRFYDVTGGTITIDGQDIRDVTLSSLREALGVVPQDPSLFNDSILENVRYARLGASDDEVHEACKAASIHDKILTFPDGYKTKVGERGVKLSGGELQRVSIARVFLKNPQIVLLDEATSAVDSSTEAQIQESFKKLSAGRTTFIIAHRLSTIMEADRILVVDNGEVVERGTHQELLERGGRYVELWTKQSSK